MTVNRGGGSLGFLVGIDGGGAKTAAALCDPEGRVLARVRGAGSAIVGTPGEAFFAVVEPLLQTLCERADMPIDRVDRVVLGLSGVDYPDETRAQHELIAARLGLGARLRLVNDGLVALWGLSATERLALVQHGTGITTAYRRAFGEEAIFDSLDVAEVFDVRRAAVSLTARMIDGRAEATPLLGRVLEHCGVAAAGFSEWCMRSPGFTARRTALAQVVFAAWRDGDAAAATLVEAAARDYLLTMTVMSRRLGDGAFAACFSGGVIREGGPALQVLLARRLAETCPRASLVTPVLPPELGAVLLGAWEAGRAPADLFPRLAEQHELLGDPA
ncbi:MAG: hypothetical protein DI570_06090 [Phenylobacterium zucineum]|nr:MAG: hypothetical protein DI570_06090 [Phenylobacterium zucineum]